MGWALKGELLGSSKGNHVANFQELIKKVKSEIKEIRPDEASKKTKDSNVVFGHFRDN